MCSLTTTLTSVFVRTGAVKPGAAIVTNLLTYPPVEAGILVAASINAAMYPWNVASSTLKKKEFITTFSDLPGNCVLPENYE